MENIENKVEIVEPVKELTIPEINLKIEDLKKQFTEKTNLFKEYKKTIDSFLTSLFKRFEINESDVSIYDSKNEYFFELVKDKDEKILRMTKRNRHLRSRFGWFGGMHPMEMMEMMMEREMEKEEIFYENNNNPKSDENIDYYEILKDDILKNGSISQIIKKYLLDKEERNNLRRESDKISVEIDNLSRKIERIKNAEREEKIKELRKKFENVPELFQNKVVLKKEDGYNFNQCGVSTLTFKKETEENYYVELNFFNGEEELVKTSKKKFKIEKFINI